PVSCFTYIVSELSGTSLLELKNFKENASRFQQQVEETIYDNYITSKYISKGGSNFSGTSSAKGFDPNNVAIPHLTNYQQQKLEDVLSAQWIDILLLALYCILFFAAGFVAFNRYDVR
ncbi:MAG: hypothetical protein U9P14_08040, partial [Gemmatimonadota bacterium]|nr:hypothetical protein [Gemmatimonadota bacterium]